MNFRVMVNSVDWNFERNVMSVVESANKLSPVLYFVLVSFKSNFFCCQCVCKGIPVTAACQYRIACGCQTAHALSVRRGVASVSWKELVCEACC